MLWLPDAALHLPLLLRMSYFSRTQVARRAASLAAYVTQEGAPGMPQQAGSVTAEAEQRLMEKHPGWQVWAVRLTEGNRLLWSAMPEGAVAVVISDEPSPEDLTEAIDHYEQHLGAHLYAARLNAAGQPDTGVGRDNAKVLGVLVTALEKLQASREGSGQ